MNELVAISNGVAAVAARLDGAKPANAMVAGPADISATPSLDFCTEVSTGTPPNIAFDSPDAT